MEKLKMNLILGLLLTAIGVSNCFFTRPILDNDTRTENADESASDYNPYPGNWMVVSQPFDHFNESNQRTFYQVRIFIILIRMCYNCAPLICFSVVLFHQRQLYIWPADIHSTRWTIYHSRV